MVISLEGVKSLTSLARHISRGCLGIKLEQFLVGRKVKEWRAAATVINRRIGQEAAAILIEAPASPPKAGGN